jgi:hypothetical protein
VVALLGAAFALPSSKAAAQNLPNLTPRLTPVIVAPEDAHGNVPRGISITHEGPFSSADGDVLDGCIAADVPVKLLRFSLDTQNEGYDIVTVGGEPSIPGLTNDPTYVWSNSHNHYHLRNFASFSLIDVGTRASQPLSGQKYTFHLEDSNVLDYRCDAPNYSIGTPCSPPILDPAFANPFPYTPTGNTMSIVHGYTDLYELKLGCQYLQIDGVPDGTYDFVVKVNSGGGVVEGRMFDNATSMRITISGDTPSISLSTWDSAPSTLVPSTSISQPPAVVSRQVNSYDLLYVGTDGNLYAKRQDPSTGGWSPDGASGPGAVVSTASPAMIGPPAAMTVGSDRLIVLARSSDGRMFRFYWTTPGDLPAQAPYELAGPGAGPPAIVASGAQSALGAWIQADGTLRYVDFNAFTSFSLTWLSGTTGGSFATDQTPAIAASGAGMFHVFVRDNSGAVQYRRYDYGTGWIGGGWTNLGGSVVGNLSAASPYLNRVDVFAHASDNSLWWNTWNGSGFSLGNHYVGNVGSSPTAISTGPRSLDVFYYAQSDPRRYYRQHFDGTSWTSQFLGSLFCSNPGVPAVAGSWADGTLDLFQEWCDGTVLVRSLR